MMHAVNLCQTISLILITSSILAAETFEPFTKENVPQTVTQLWQNIDPAAEPLETNVVKQWEQDGVVCRYVIFTVGTFKGKPAKLAAFYTFPKQMVKGPAIVWSHGGGQRAELARGLYYAKHGYATIDINWGGREIYPGIKQNTDWGNVDPSQGPKFYPGALRPSTKQNLLADPHTIDPVPSPRNGNWFLLAYAGRRAITFLTQQAEVDPSKIGFTGYSMGGTITSIVSIDKRLKAVAPMVGGSGFRLEDFPGLAGVSGLPGNGSHRQFQHPELFNSTIDPAAYWPHVSCPVLFLSASNDFHSAISRIFRSMQRIPHDDWRVSLKMHDNHSLGPQQWILLKLWFDKHLKNLSIDLPQKAKSTLVFSEGRQSALLTVDPDQAEKLSAVDIFYSHDPNPHARFWIRAQATRQGNRWEAELPVQKDLPLLTFANCTYPLEKSEETFQGTTESFTLTSKLESDYPVQIKYQSLHDDSETNILLEDFQAHGFKNWSANHSGNYATYLFQDPRFKRPADHQRLKITLQMPDKKLSFRFRVEKNKYLPNAGSPQALYFANRPVIEKGVQTILLKPSDFQDREQTMMTDWENVSRFYLQVYDAEAKRTLQLEEAENRSLLQSMQWVK